ncbi:MAG: hypothetical protein WCJ51_04890, partial [Candidatus Moraniibacteriota bacterium]
ANFDSQLPQGRGDIFQAMANIDSRVVTVSGLDFAGKLTFFVKNLGVHLPYVFLNLFFNKYVAYNLLFLASFVLSGLGAYLLAFYFTKNKLAAFLAGVIFAFSPFHFYQATVVNLGTMHQEWLPFLALALFRFFEKFQLKYFLAFCFFAFLIAVNEHQMLAFCVLFMVLLAGYKIALDRSILKNKKFWLYVACSLGLLAIVAFGMFGEMLKVATSKNNFLDAGENAANRYAIKMLDPLAPPIFHGIWPGASEFLQKIMLGDANRGSYFVGFSVLAVLLYFAYLLKKKKVAEMKEQAYRQSLTFWGLATLVFYVFSLGNSFSIGKFTIYLPYYLIYKFVPFYENIRTTGRMFVLVELGVAILFAYGFGQLQKKYLSKKIQLAMLFGMLILLEFWVAPMALMTVSYSTFYDKIAKETEVYKLLEIPGSTSYEFASYAMMTDAVHKKAVLNGMPLARKISGQFDFQQETPIIKQLLYTIPKGNDPQTKNSEDILQGFAWEQATDILNYYQVGYITISKLYAKKDVQKLAEDFVEKYVACTNHFEDKYLVAYQIKKQTPTGFFAQLENDNQQFSDTFKNAEGALQREVGSGAQFRVVNMESQIKMISLTLDAQILPGLAFEILQNGENLKKQKITASGDLSKIIFEIQLAPGENKFEFAVRDSEGKPVLVREKKKNPVRALVVSKMSFSAPSNLVGLSR